MNEEPDFYTVLKISPDATPDEIKHAYRQLARQSHPDVKADLGTALLFRQIQQAYEILSDPGKRSAYDRRLMESGRSPKSPFVWKMQPSRTTLLVLPDDQVLYVLLDVAAGQGSQQAGRMPLNVCLVLDRSTSMQGARLEQTKASAQRMIDSLTSDDTLGIVTFSDKAEVVWPSQSLTDPIKVKARVSAIQASGGTEILQGLNAGLAELEKHRLKYSISHLILLTDGQTYGDEEKCLAVAVEAKKHRIGISAMGIGEDWNDTLLDALASRSGGVSQYIASTGEIQHFLRERLQGLGAVYADNLRLTLKATEQVHLKNAFKLSPYIQRIEIDNDSLVLGALQSDSPISGMLEITVGPHAAGNHRVAQLELTGDIPTQHLDGVQLRQDLRFAFDPQANPNTPAPPNVLSALAKITIFQMQEGAWQALEKGDVANATHRLETMATRLLDMGEHQLARAALLEAGRLARSGNLSPAGRKAIKYGTRSLILAPTKEK
jgi:Ca-activated chloride channel family protein